MKDALKTTADTQEIIRGSAYKTGCLKLHVSLLFLDIPDVNHVCINFFALYYDHGICGQVAMQKPIVSLSRDHNSTSVIQNMHMIELSLKACT